MNPVKVISLVVLTSWATGMIVHNRTQKCTKVYNTLSVTITAYRPIRAQTDSSPNWTSLGTPAVMGVCAASRDLLANGSLCYGDIVDVPDLGVYKVMDTMNDRHKNHLDILVYTKTQEKYVGWKKNVNVRRIFCVKEEKTTSGSMAE